MQKDFDKRCAQRLHWHYWEVEDTIPRWCSKEVSQLSPYEEGNEWDCKRPGETVVDLEVERQDGYKIVSYPLWSQCSSGTYFIPLETDQL